MDVPELFKGIAIVIDDEVNNSKAHDIRNILNQITDQNIPLLAYESIPDEKVILHFQNLSFVLLDWRLIKQDITAEDLEAGAKVPATLEQHEATENIEFIKKLKDVCFCPIFIFTNEDKADVIAKLEEGKLYATGKPSHIFVKSKADLQNGTKLFDVIESWLKETPSVYVLKEWEREYQKCKNRLFSEFQELSPVWPQIMWNNFDVDGGNKSLELGELISRNLQTRMAPFEFDDELLKAEGVVVEREELRRVLEGERFLKGLHPDAISTGDIFKESYEDGEVTKYRYWLNIRAQCDLVRTDNPSLYCIPGYILTQNAKGKIENISFNNGEYLEKNNHAIVPFIDDGKILEFKFSGFEIRDLNSLKTKQINRIGCLLPPYITKIQQRYALYIHRQGLPRIPDAAIFNP